MKNTVIYQEGEKLKMDFITMANWDDFDSIERYIIKYFSAKLLNRVNGPESKISFFEIEDKQLSLHNNPYGNTLEGFLIIKPILKKISDDIENRLSR